MEEIKVASALRTQFPQRAAEVLEREHRFVLADGGFTLEDAGAGSAWRRVYIELPQEATEAAKLRATGGFTILVREIGLEGRGIVAGNAVAYRRAGGTSLWTVGASGVEEWLHLEAGVARADEPVATWEVEGATLRQRDSVVEVVDDTGFVQMAVSAPRAYAGGEREIEARLVVAGSRIELFADGGDEAVLIDPSWSATAPMGTPRHYHTATLLANGKILVAGGRHVFNGPGSVTTELYDPATNSWAAAAPMSNPRYSHTATILSNGKVLVAGGETVSAEIYDAETDTWTPAGSMSSTHTQGVSARLASGKVLVVGGVSSGASAEADLYDPVSNTWTNAAPMNVPRGVFAAVRLNDGNVLVIGGWNSDGILSSCELYNPTTNTWTVSDPMSNIRAYHTATLLSNGTVLVAGGQNSSFHLTTAQVYDPTSDTWMNGGTLSFGRNHSGTALLANGKVLIANGDSGATAELYDPVSKTWAFAGTMSTSRYNRHTVTKLGGDSVLIAGGVLFPTTVLASTEMFIQQNGGSSCVGAGECTSGFCVDGVCCSSACGGGCMACSATKKGSGTDGTCGGISANTDPDNECSAECNGAGACEAANGAACTLGSQCQSGYCVDGVCCNSACSGTCVACLAAKKGSGTNGTCGNIGTGSDPDNECATQAASTCGTTGVCNGAGACQKYSNATTCVAGSCMGTLAYKADLCSGSGTCIDSGTQECSPYACSSGVCLTTCSTDSQCTSTAYCNAPTCTPKKSNGQACSAANQCTSGHCVDGVCCNSACSGTCVACSAAKKGSGTDGTCENVSGGLDPDNECTTQAASTCGTTGACNSAGACQQHSSGTTCVAGSCMGTLAYEPDLCNGSGTCIDSGTQECAPYGCTSGACLTTCSTDSQCASTAYCNAPICTPKKANGQSCSAAKQCTSGYCVDGVCCNSACSGTCEACSAAKKGSGTDGTCGTVSAGFDNDNECTAQAPSTCGTTGACDGAGACQKYPSETICGAASCSGTLLFKASLCDGNGTCIDGSDAEDCHPYMCSDGACLTSCFIDTQCSGAHYCKASVCTPKEPTGEECTSPSKCLSGHCVDGVCCESACNGVCTACSVKEKGSGIDGTCDYVDAGLDPHSECTAQVASTCDTTGVCDGAGACQKYSSDTICVAGSCVGTVAYKADLCSGSGECIDSGTEECAPFACSNGACLTSCWKDSDCSPVAYCNATTCTPKKATGEQCGSANQCMSGFCADGVCCDGACDGVCDGCSAAKKGGGEDGICGPLEEGADPDGRCVSDSPTGAGGSRSLYACATVISRSGSSEPAGLGVLAGWLGVLIARRSRGRRCRRGEGDQAGS